MNSRNTRPTIGFLLSWFDDTYTQTVFKAAVEDAYKRDINLICFEAGRINSPFEDNRYQILCDLAGPERLDGLIIFSEGMDQFVSHDDVSEMLRRRFHPNLPIVSVGALKGIPSVATDLKSGMRELITHLVEVHGCKHIALIHGPESQDAAIALFQGYLEALEEHKLQFDPLLVTNPGVWGPALGVEAVRSLMDERQIEVDAILGGDPEASGALQELQRRGMSVPFDIVVAGYNDLELARFTTPPLTTVDRQVGVTAQNAIDLMLQAIQGESIPELTLLPTKAIIRRSCGCIPENIKHAAVEVQLVPKPYTSVFAEQRSLIVSLIEKEVYGFSVEFNRLPQLIDKLLAIADGASVDIFLNIFESILEETADAEENVEAWHEIISNFRRALCPLLVEDNCALQRVENCLQQARMMVSAMIEQVYAEARARERKAEEILRNVSRSLIARFDMAGMLKVLATELPRLGMRSCYLSLYDDPTQPTQLSRLVFAYNDSGQIAIEPGGLRFPSQELVPRSMLPVERAYVLMVESLYFDDEQLGIIVFEVGPRDGYVYSALRSLISNALIGAELMKAYRDMYDQAVAARQVAEEANRLKGSFLSMVSHELRTPLSLITGTIEMMESSNKPLPPSLNKDLWTIRTSAEHLSHLIGDVLDLTSSHASELRLVCVPLDLTELLEEVSILAEPMARGKGLAWRSEVPVRLPLVWGDPARLRQAVFNLVNNAIKFTKHGEVVLRAQVKDKELLIKVWDTGVGIPPEELENIFDEFHQSERTTQRGYGGIGLGLAITRRLVELHGGKISVISTGEEGVGSTFSISLPVMQDLPVPEKYGPTISNTILLIVEHPKNGDKLLDHLSQRGFEIEEIAVQDQPDWLHKVIIRNPAAVILDYEPATERGWELMKAIKENPATQDVPVIFYSLLPGQNAGSILELDYLFKPLHSSQLSLAMERFDKITKEGPERRTILIVDDDPSLLTLYERMVRSLRPGCHIFAANNGREALDVMERELPNLVLLDLMMPELDGFGVLEAMQAREVTREIPVIILTAKILSSDEIARLQHGVMVILEKGIFTTDEVFKKVETAMLRGNRLGSEAQRLIRQTMAFIHDHFAEDLSRKDLAQHVSVSERYLTRCFHQVTGLTPITYLNRYRIAIAKSLLERNNLSVTDVAMAVGFSDGNYFGRIFKDEVGVSPRNYQRKVGENNDSILTDN